MSSDGTGDNTADLEGVLADVLQKLKPLDAAGKRRVLDAISVFYSLGSVASHGPKTMNPTVISSGNTFTTERPKVNPKEFLRDKAPKSDIEKVVCLAYFLTHYRETQHFKTIDISKLNTEAAQLKFSNAAYAVDNAGKRGFLVPAGKNGTKQISAMGEQFVNALPDREAAKAAQEQIKTRRKKTSGRPKRADLMSSESDTDVDMSDDEVEPT